MVAEGNPNLPDTPADKQMTHLLDELGRVGWSFAGGGSIANNTISIAFNALNTQQQLSPEEFGKQLGIVTEEGLAEPGFIVGILNEDGKLDTVGDLGFEYEGLFTDKVVAVFTGMVALADTKPNE
jgi:hypothetical protein